MKEIAKELIFPNLENEFYLLDGNAKIPVIDHYPSISKPFKDGKLIIYYDDFDVGG